jgi:ribosomal subunit interface protein
VKIRLSARNVTLTDRLRVHVRRRLELALGRFGDRIDKVSVRFTDADAGRGPAQNHCRIEVGLHPRPVTVEDVDADPFAAADGATDRLSRAVTRALEREQDERRVSSFAAAGSKP